MSDLKSLNICRFTQEYLLRRFEYNPETGVLTWRPHPENKARNWNSRFAGKVAGHCKQDTGRDRYSIAIRLDGKCLCAHVIIWKMVHGTNPIEIDHINGDALDNRLVNLRECTPQQNRWNRGVGRTSSTGVVGVSFKSGRKVRPYCAEIRCDGIFYHLGYYDTVEEAAAVRQKAERRLYGQYAASVCRAPTYALDKPQEQAIIHASTGGCDEGTTCAHADNCGYSGICVR